MHIKKEGNGVPSFNQHNTSGGCIMSEFIYKAFRYRLYPNCETQIAFNQWFGCCRKVFNVTLDESIKQYEAGNKNFVNRSSFCSMITKLKADGEHDYLKQVPIHTLQNSLADLLDGYNRFFKGIGEYPKFKSKHDSKQSFTVPCSSSIIKNCRFDNNRVWIPNLKKLIKFKQHRKIEGVVKSYTITRETTGKWYISFLCHITTPQKIEKAGAVGLDFGVLDFFTDSNGNKIPARKFLRSMESKLKRMQRVLSKKVKGSNNYKKLKQKIARLYDYISNCRKDSNQKLSTILVNENQVISIEDLAISKMSRNHKLAKSLLDEGWYQFTSMLDYKMKWYGGSLVKIDRFFPSSKTCSACGYKVSKVPLNVREWVCPECGCIHDRDVNAAQNILAEGLRLLGL